MNLEINHNGGAAEGQPDPYARAERAQLNAAVIAELVAEDAATVGRERAMEIWSDRLIEVGAEYRAAWRAAVAAARHRLGVSI